MLIVISDPAAQIPALAAGALGTKRLVQIDARELAVEVRFPLPPGWSEWRASARLGPGLVPSAPDDPAWDEAADGTSEAGDVEVWVPIAGPDVMWSVAVWAFDGDDAGPLLAVGTVVGVAAPRLAQVGETWAAFEITTDLPGWPVLELHSSPEWLEGEADERFDAAVDGRAGWTLRPPGSDPESVGPVQALPADGWPAERRGWLVRRDFEPSEQERWVRPYQAVAAPSEEA